MFQPRSLNIIRFTVCLLRFGIFPIKKSFATDVSSSIKTIGLSNINCILTDIDGTVLTSDHKLPDRTLNAIKNCMKKGYKFFPCTGRSRKSMTTAVGHKFVELFGTKEEDIMGVFQQGLTVYGPNNTIIYENFLEQKTIQKSVQFCDLHNIAVVAYAADDIYVTKQSYYSNKITEYAEPLATEHFNGIENLEFDKGKHIHT